MAGMNFSTLVYLPVFDQFARTVIVNPVVSQPGQAAYTNRGIFDTRPVDVQALDGSIYSDQQTILDIREVEYAVIPEQGDIISIPADDAGPAQGSFMVDDTDSNAGGETTILLKRIVTAKP